MLPKPKRQYIWATIDTSGYIFIDTISEASAQWVEQHGTEFGIVGKWLYPTDGSTATFNLRLFKGYNPQEVAAYLRSYEEN